MQRSPHSLWWEDTRLFGSPTGNTGEIFCQQNHRLEEEQSLCNETVRGELHKMFVVICFCPQGVTVGARRVSLIEMGSPSPVAK